MDAAVDAAFVSMDAARDGGSSRDAPGDDATADAALDAALAPPDAPSIVDAAVTPDAFAECASTLDCPALPHMTATCDGRCRYDCDTDFEDCNTSLADGCEIDTRSDPEHCGSCPNACGTYAHTSTSCVMGSCRYDCASDHASCDATLPDCETALGTAAACSGCGMTCMGAFALCDGPPYACTSTCASPREICGSSCVDTTSSPAHCGGCDMPCPDRAFATELCETSACTLSCDPNRGNCDGLDGNGCEINTLTSLAHCGGCDMPCAFDHASESCVGGTCTFGACEGHFDDCDGSTVNGCERDLDSDASHCGACGHVCPASTQCIAGVCNPFIDVAPGEAHACALRDDGTAYCWGTNDAGQLGDGTSDDRGLPRVVVGSARFSQITTGVAFSCAIERSAGAVYCWGRNQEGELGDGTRAGRATPAPIQPRTDFAAAFAGRRFLEVRAMQSSACARDDAGAVWCWGRNDRGQVGDGTTAEADAAVRLGLTDVRQISAGYDFGCARLMTGEVRCWGGNAAGQLGDGTTSPRTAPVTVMGLVGAQTLSSGTGHTCAIASSQVYCWGQNTYGALGLAGGNRTSAVPNTVTASELHCGQHVCFARQTALAWLAWGYDDDGQLGNGTTGPPRTSPAATALPPSMTPSPGLNAMTVCGIDGGRLSCWGGDYNATLGAAETAVIAPSPVSDASGPLTGIDRMGLGQAQSCVLRSGELSCAGSYYAYAAFLPIASDRPRVVPTLPTSVIDVGAGSHYTCAAVADTVAHTGTVYCWGSFPGLGVASTTPPFTTFTIAGGEPRSLSVGPNHLCALVHEPDGDDIPYCMGRNAYGALGRGTTTPIETSFAPITGPHADFAEVEVGADHTCARRRGGGVSCWGYAGNGRIGDGAGGTTQPTPSAVSGLSDAIDLAVGSAHACVARMTGSVECWGYNANGELGIGLVGDQPTPVAVTGVSAASSVAAASGVSCAVVTGGQVACWGANRDGERGTGARGAMTVTATTVPGLTNVAELFSVHAFANERAHLCGVRSDRTAVCWGLATLGRCATGRSLSEPTPTLVGGLTY
ncbi:MAG: hypothetical protein U0353_24540 [Sandaracinus sp.]